MRLVRIERVRKCSIPERARKRRREKGRRTGEWESGRERESDREKGSTRSTINKRPKETGGNETVRVLRVDMFLLRFTDRYYLYLLDTYTPMSV